LRSGIGPVSRLTETKLNNSFPEVFQVLPGNFVFFNALDYITDAYRMRLE
jgi:hypothetical protein